MKIISSTIAMTSQHSLVERDVEQESLEVWSGKRANTQSQQESVILLAVPQDVVDISDQAQQMQGVQAQDEETFELSDQDKQRLQLIRDFIQQLTGKKLKFVIPIEDFEVKLTTKQPAILFGQQVTGQGQSQGQGNLGWGLRYNYYQSHFEQETTRFAAAGIVKTADGREIDLAVQVSMSRQFMAEQNISIKAGDALKDPLVINFDAAAAKLTTTKYSFDIDSDGQADQIAFTGSGSGFLALDLNGDGTINNGKELFGPDSGNGFADLAQYDSDGNSWIDENDAIYEKLRIWTKDEQGNDQLLALGQKGAGAIYLGNISTEFALKDNTNQQQGQLRSTGIFLRENGMVGTIQQVDLIV